MRIRPDQLWFVIIGFTLGVILVPASARAAAPVVSNALVELRGSVAVPDVGTVSLSGLVHIVTRVVPVDDGHLVTVYANLPADVSAEGPQETHFIAHGASRHADVHDISNGQIIPCVMPGFTLLLADPSGTGERISPVTFEIELLLQFSETGQLVGGSALTGRLP